MTGAGSATVAWAAETSYNGGVAAEPTYREPGRNVQVQTAELSNNLLKILAPNDAEARRYLAQNLDGQLGVSFVLLNDEYHRLVFNSGNTTWTTGWAPSAEWYLGLDYLDGTVERQIQGWFAATCQIQYQGPDGPVRVTLTGPYATEDKNTSITPGSIERAGTEVAGHAASLVIDGTTQTKEQSFQLDMQGIYRGITGTSRELIDAVNANPDVQLTTETVYTEDDQLELAYGSSGSTSPQDTMDDGVTASVSFDVGGSTIADYSVANIYPDTYDWADLVNPDTDITEPITWNVAGVTGSDPDA